MRASTTRNSVFRRILTGVLAAAFWLLVWQLVYLYVEKEILVVSPFRVARRLVQLAAEISFWRSVGATCLRVITGFVISLLLGVTLAVISFRFKFLYALLRPLFDVIKATPVASFIILALIWISSGTLPAFIAFLMVMPLVWSNLYSGLEHVNTGLLEMSRVFRFGRWKKIRLIYAPALMPYFVAACSTGLGFAWKCAIAAEVISHPKNSIGVGIYNARIYLEPVDLFSWTFVVILLSVILEKLTIWLIGCFGDWLLNVGKSGGGGKPGDRQTDPES